ncbi:DUF3868 domain-containing protein [Bacteroides sp. UBA939]|uniref:DUF3868 domain-containing protein n=1 Tax=Bacteroides sp. UBA939 TaxID=1946092 RepID=UPI0025C2592B|nr:DUF3868 domain-containing protein [Bacteroides sp. UBA939]
MKKIICIFFGLLLVLGAKAQTLYNNQVRIEKQSVTRNEDTNLLSIDMDIVMQENLDLTSNHVAMLIPFLEANGRTKVLPPIVVYGRKREIVHQRNNTDMVPEDAYVVMRRKRHEEQTVNYRQQFPFEAWMRNAAVKLNIDVCGCCDLKEEGALLSTGEEITRMDFAQVKINPVVSYIVPQAEAVKRRAIEGNAFLDFPVNKIIIYPTYRNNTIELAKIRASIDSVRNDDKTIITGIKIHGYASPEGGYANNTRLAKGRTQSLVDYVTSYYKFDRSLITSDHTPEDWAGFRKYIVDSSFEKKDAILKLMDDTGLNLDKKERQIAQMVGPAVYRKILDDCYPALRHSDYTINYTVRGFTVEESKDLLKKSPHLLSLQEMYRIAETYQPGSEEFNEVFRIAVDTFSNDPIANLNAAAMEIEKGDLSTAKEYLAKADPQAGETLNNLGVIALTEGDLDAAERYFNAAKAAGLTTQPDANLRELKKKRVYPVD